MSTKIYNVGAWGVPAVLIEDVDSLGPLPLRYSRHSMLEAMIQRDGFVRTLWTNLNSDGHATLNKERFDKP